MCLLQAAKVVSAHASSVGDALLAVPLHCAAGLYAEAVGVLQVRARVRNRGTFLAVFLLSYGRAERRGCARPGGM